jgi:flagellar assembly protein FliH
MIEAAVKEVGVKSGYVIKVKPSAVQWLEKVLKVAQAEGQSRNWTIQSDATIELGGCLFESPEGNLDARLETQIEILRTALLENRGASGSGKPQP